MDQDFHPKLDRWVCSNFCGCWHEHRTDPHLVLRRAVGGAEGIVNGMDVTEWNPKTDKYVPVKYDRTTVFEGKAAAKAALQAEMGLPVDPTAPLFGYIGRLEEQKGVDILLAVSVRPTPLLYGTLCMAVLAYAAMCVSLAPSRVLQHGMLCSMQMFKAVGNKRMHVLMLTVHVPLPLLCRLCGAGPAQAGCQQRPGCYPGYRQGQV